MKRLSLSEARRVALHAQGFGARRPAKVNAAHVGRMAQRLGAIQIDAVNVLVRSHYLPVFSRLGTYEMALLDRVAYERPRVFEYVAHAASYVSVDLHPALRWRMEEEATNKYWAASRRKIEERTPGYVEKVLTEISERGPLSFKELTDPARYERPETKYAESTLLWWSKRPSDGKHVLEGLWRQGRLAVAGRRPGFERAFDLPERVIPLSVLEAPTPAPADAQRTLVAHAARALGIASVKELADYFRLPVATARARVAELLEEGDLQEASIEGVSGKWFLHRSASSAPVTARALLSPFDSLLWERTRNVELFGFRHSFEIYVPEPRREYGYYVLPFLLGETMAGRVDLKAERDQKTLRVLGAFGEHDHPAPASTIAFELAAALREMAGWLALERIEVGARGDLAARLRREVAT